MNKIIFFFLLALIQLPVFASNFAASDSFKIESVKPWGKYGFRAIGNGTHLTEVRFNCGQASDMGVIVTTINHYGKRNQYTIPGGLNNDKESCQAVFRKYFDGVGTGSRTIAGKKSSGIIDLNSMRSVRSIGLR